MSNYQISIDKVLTYIDAKLSEKPELDKLAEMAHLSKFHFHRIMRAYLDEALGTYINRLRLETAVKLLRYATQPIKEIAYQVGYDTPSAFSKGLKKMYGVSPSAIRKNKNLFVNQKTAGTMEDFQLVQTIKTIKNFEVIFQQSKGKIGDKTTAENWDSLFTNAIKHQVINADSKFYGINWDDPEITVEEKVRYDACISISNADKIQSSFSIKTIFGGKYLCFLYKGDYQNLALVYNQIFREWVIKMNYSLREAPIFEQYINNKAITPVEDLLTEIFIPIN